MEIQKKLTQAEIDSLVEALNNLKDYGHDPEVSDDILKNQVVLSQSEIDRLIASLNGVKEAPDAVIRDKNVSLSQNEIDSLIDALNTFKQYDVNGSFAQEITMNQTILSQEEIDKLINTLTGLKTR